jgi:hypothetical protein
LQHLALLGLLFTGAPPGGSTHKPGLVTSCVLIRGTSQIFFSRGMRARSDQREHTQLVTGRHSPGGPLREDRDPQPNTRTTSLFRPDALRIYDQPVTTAPQFDLSLRQPPRSVTGRNGANESEVGASHAREGENSPSDAKARETLAAPQPMPGG